MYTEYDILDKLILLCWIVYIFLSDRLKAYLMCLAIAREEEGGAGKGYVVVYLK